MQRVRAAQTGYVDDIDLTETTSTHRNVFLFLRCRRRGFHKHRFRTGSDIGEPQLGVQAQRYQKARGAFLLQSAFQACNVSHVTTFSSADSISVDTA
jgi:hypothetical protein